ncbi:unnamed protein product, partial [Polarella glacialis]
MALPQILACQDLFQFRTKPCERLLTSGNCTFGDRCQYSHNLAWPRRQENWCSLYAPRLCPVRDNCPLGRSCGLAHTEEEVLYHLEVYKTTLCQGQFLCHGFFCPFAHGLSELRVQESWDSAMAGQKASLCLSPATLLLSRHRSLSLASYLQEDGPCSGRRLDPDSPEFHIESPHGWSTPLALSGGLFVESSPE